MNWRDLLFMAGMLILSAGFGAAVSAVANLAGGV